MEIKAEDTLNLFINIGKGFTYENYVIPAILHVANEKWTAIPFSPYNIHHKLQLIFYLLEWKKIKN